MELHAVHFDGFTEHLVSWELWATGNTAIVDASWLASTGPTEKTFEMDFPDSRIEQVLQVLSGLKPVYDGHTDDSPTYSLCVKTEDREFKTVVRTGSYWTEDDERDVDAFMSVWHPIYREVENLLALPRRR